MVSMRRVAILFAIIGGTVLAYEFGKPVVDAMMEDSLQTQTDASRAHGMAISAADDQ